MARRYRNTFQFFDTEKEARNFCDKRNKISSYYVKKNHKSFYTPWSSSDGSENKFIAWFETK